MGREVRRVPPDWLHPEDPNGADVPLKDHFNSRLAEWRAEKEKWESGFTPDFKGGWKPKGKDLLGMTFEEWDGPEPDAKNFMPDWPEAERTHWQMYENVSEGTPISPVLETPEALARWLADNGASAFANQTATYEQWLSTIRRGSALSMVVHGGVIESGVAAEHAFDKKEDDDEDPWPKQ